MYMFINIYKHIKCSLGKSPRLLADRFEEFFSEKIEKICSTFPIFQKSQHIAPDSPPPVLSTFCTVTEDQITKIIMKSPSKSC